MILPYGFCAKDKAQATLTNAKRSLMSDLLNDSNSGDVRVLAGWPCGECEGTGQVTYVDFETVAGKQKPTEVKVGPCPDCRGLSPGLIGWLCGAMPVARVNAADCNPGGASGATSASRGSGYETARS